MIDKKHLSGDIFGGINAGIVALPAALGFGTLAGLEPIYGLYCAIFLGLVAPLIGGSKTLISNPTGPMAVVTLLVVNKLNTLSFVGYNDQYYRLSDLKTLGVAEGDLAEHLSSLQAVSFGDRLLEIWPVLFLIIIVAGVIQALFGIFKLGKYIHYIPTPVVSGFMSGIGVIIIVSQIPKFFGAQSPAGGTLGVLSELFNLISNAHLTPILIGLGTMAVIYLFPKITTKVPSPLFAIVLACVAAYLVGVDAEYLLNDLPDSAKKIPNPLEKLPPIFSRLTERFSGEEKWKLLTFVLGNGLTLAIIGIIDALLTAVVGDQLTKEKHDSDREMIGQGLGNIVSATFGGMMGAGTTPATVLNIKSGARTRLSGVVHALFLVVILLIAFQFPVISLIPQAALAGLLITVGISILDIDAFKALKKIPKQDNFIMILVLVLTSCWDLMYAVAAGLIIAALVFMKEMADVVEGKTKNSKFDRLVDQLIDTFENSEGFRDQVVVKNLQGPMFFGFASRFQDQMDEIDANKKAIVLNFGGVTYMDQSGMYTLREAVERMVAKDIIVLFSELRERDADLLEGIRVIPEMVDENHVFSSVEEAVMWLNEPGHLEDDFAGDQELYIPSAYTPNGDGINDEWQLRNINRYPNCTVLITNREGKELFYSVGYQEMWEGIYNGRVLPSDQYLYVIDLQGDGQQVLKGKVSIFR